MTSATASGVETASTGMTSRKPMDKGSELEGGSATGSTTQDATGAKLSNGTARTTEELRRSFRQKYRHVAAVHSASKSSCLSHDAPETPSFIGFRNLMVIVLGMALPVQPCQGNKPLTAEQSSATFV